MTANIKIDEYPDRIAELYENKTILISGGSGFIGKVLVEKLLRSCTGLKKIIIILRTKKGKDPNERLQIIKNDELFRLVKQEKGEDVMNKLEAVSGDMMETNLALSTTDADMIKREAEIIFHCAANVKFDEPLKYSLLLNVGGTKGMLDLAKECQQLLLFAHVSTAYCYPQEKVLYEKVYAPPADPHLLLEIAHNKSSYDLEIFTSRILGDYPNTYTFAKALSEKLVTDEMKNLPIILLRPSVVIPVWKEPIPGWTDNINGPLGLLIAAGKGVLRSMYCKSDSYADFLPVDIGANFIIVSSYDYLTYKTRTIYNLTTSSLQQFTWENIIDMGRTTVETRIPFNVIAWYPGGSMTRSKMYHTIRFYLFHLLPAIFADILLYIFRIRPVLLHVQQRIYKGYDLLEYYANNQWDFSNDNAMTARDLLNPRERQLYKTDDEGFDLLDYITGCVHAARRYILKEKDESIESAKIRMKIMWFVDRAVKTLFIIGMIYYVLPRILNAFASYWNSL